MAQPIKKSDKQQQIKLPTSLKDAFIDDEYGLDYDWRDNHNKLTKKNK